MSKPHSKYVCQQCGYSQVKWAGKCPKCGAWGSMVEVVTEEASGRKTGRKGRSVSLYSISSKKIPRTSTRLSELDRVLGGGIVPGQVILIAGEPGVGKSTILLQLAENLGNVLYVSGEESVSQIALRAKRLGIKKKTIKVMEETDIDVVVAAVEEHEDFKLRAIVVDSIQTMATTDLSGLAGSVGQVRECAHRLVKLAKQKNIPVFIVGHVTKQGSVAGPSVLMHVVDTVLWFEGDSSLTLRLLRAVKNRFGPTDEVGVFKMGDKGLIGEANPEKLFLSKATRNQAGSAITTLLHGTRPLLVEIQALVVPTKTAFPRRIAQGIDSKRFELLIAILSRRCGVPLQDYDCYLSVSGGISIKEPASDLAVCLALASSYFDKPLPLGVCAIGEVGLLGEIRAVVSQDKRGKQAKRLGYKVLVTSKEFKFLHQVIKRYLK